MPGDYRLFGRLLAGDDHARDVILVDRTAPVCDAAHLVRGLRRDRDLIRRTLRQRARQHEFAVRRDRQLLAIALQLETWTLQAGDRTLDTDAEVAAANLDIRDVRLGDRARAIRYVAALQRQNRRVRHGDVVARTAEHRRRERERAVGGRVEAIAAVVRDDHARPSQTGDRAADRELAQRASDDDVDDVVICHGTAAA